MVAVDNDFLVLTQQRLQLVFLDAVHVYDVVVGWTVPLALHLDLEESLLEALRHAVSHLDAVAETPHEVIQNASYAIQVFLDRAFWCAQPLQRGTAVGEYGAIAVLRHEIACFGRIH